MSAGRPGSAGGGPPPDGGTAAAILGVGGALGLAADRLLWAGPVGPGLAVWLALLGGSAAVLARARGWPWSRATAGWAVVAVLAGAGTAWRASPVLGLLLLGVVVAAGSQVLLEARGRRLGRTRVLDHVHGLGLVPWLAAAGTAGLVSRATLPAAPDRRRALALGRGVLLSLAPLALFGALFVAADPVFERLVERVVPDTDVLPAHVFLVGAFGWIAAGLLSGVPPGRRPNPLDAFRPPRVGIEETAVVLGLVATLFALFVAVQFSYLFGGLEVLRATSGLTLAEYARRGFFELVTVAGLVLVLLLVVGAASPRGPGGWVFRSLAGLLIALVMCVIVSAALRLRLYVAEFGLTAARFYAAAAMAWLAVTLSLYAATVVRRRPRAFASGAFLAAIAAVFLLALANPDATVARTNLGRASTRPVDGAYLAWRLSADAAPLVLDRLESLEPRARCAAVDALLTRWGPGADRRPGAGEASTDRGATSDWRTYNVAIAAAERRVRHPETLRRLESRRVVCRAAGMGGAG